MSTIAPHASLPAIRGRLHDFDFVGLFNDLGWDHLRSDKLLDIDGATYDLRGIAHKKGFQVFRCGPGAAGEMPDRATRRKIDREISKEAQEHLLIFTDAEQTTQVWQWVRREPGKPLQPHEHELRAGQSGEALAQRLQRLYVSLDEEENLTIVDVAGRVRGTFDAERVTRRFYDRFRQEHQAFRAFISGIPNEDDLDWYASLMLNRLMFVYFIQKKGFLDNDQEYLRHKLALVREARGEGQFHSFYRRFLLRLFHEGLSQQEGERDSGLDALLGSVPYLNGGLFDVHALEAAYDAIDIPDRAFENLFAFFDAYRWHLDERPLREDNEINPDVLGYIFEKYVNQKQMGAYYTKEDITGYIARNTIIPAIFDKARPDVRIAFAPGSATWRLLQENPDRYIYPAVRHGTDLSLPPDIAVGLNDVSQRGGWNRPAPTEYALPTETWREHVARRTRYEEVWQRLVGREISAIDDLVTLNLDIHQFAVDAIAECEGPETLRAFWKAIQGLSVLDPTCGSGAFLFAALTILQPLAEACLERMQAFVDELEQSGEHHPDKYRDFRQTLDDVGEHPNREYFVLKQIVLNNLYGVDIMEEAVEICKLRLFLKLVAQVETADQIEPLPDIDFNIRAGNTLVGFASFDDVQKSLKMASTGQMQMVEIIEAGGRSAVQRVTEEAQKAAMTFARFRALQDSTADAAATREAKKDVRARLAILRDELDRLQARVYAVDLSEPSYGDWLHRHKPFHWITEFFDIVQVRHGFDVIIGNPPWAEYATVRRSYRILGYQTETSGNLYAFCSERSLALLAPEGRFSFIVQLPITSSPRMQPIRALLEKRALSVLTFDDRPGKLFDGLQNCRSAIFFSSPQRTLKVGSRQSTAYQRWPTVRRDALFAALPIVSIDCRTSPGSTWEKVGSLPHSDVILRIQTFVKNQLGNATIPSASEYFVFYQESARYWIKAASEVPYYSRNGFVASPSHGRFVRFPDPALANIASAVLNSSLFYLWFVTMGDCFHVNDSLVRTFPVPAEVFCDSTLCALNQRLMEELRANAKITTISTRDGDQISYAEYFASASKETIDEIDLALSRHYGFSDEELDFIINYDIKYRMGIDGGDEAA
jgi:hypothetical protein